MSAAPPWGAGGPAGAMGHTEADRPSLTVWPAGRRSVAALAVFCALVTGLAGGAAGTAGWAVLTAAAHVVAALWALADTRMIGVQVGAGVLLAWSLLPETEGAGVAAVVVAVVAGVVATSELLGACARLRLVIERDPRPELLRMGLAVAVAVAVSSATVAAGGLAGPAGLVATAVAAVGCVVVAVALRASSLAGRGRDDPRGDRPARR